MNSRQLLLITVVVAVVVAVPAAGAAFAGTQTAAEMSPTTPLESTAEADNGPIDTNVTLTVSDLSAPANASEGATFTVEAIVTNTGNESGEAMVQYKFNDTVREATSVTLDAGNSTDVEFEFTAEGVEPGTYTHGVYTDSDNETAEIDIEEAEDEKDDGDDPANPGPEPGAPGDLAAFQDTSPLDENQTTPDSLAGMLRVEDQHLKNTSVELVSNSSTEYTLDITVTGNATNVTFFLQQQAVESSQNISDVVAYLDGEEMDFYVDEDAGPGNSPWMLFEVDHFSTRTVSFTSAETTESGSFDVSDLTAPANASQGEEITVEATVTNSGNESAEGTVQYKFNDTVRETTSVTLDAGNSTDVEFNFTADGVEPGTYAHGVYTDSDNETAEIEIEEAEDEEEDGNDGDDGDDGEDAGPNPGSPPSDLAAFQETSALDENQTTPDSLAGKIRVEDEHLDNTSVELVSNTSTEYTLNITVTGDATNVTFFLQQQAIESSQNISDVVAYLDGEEMDFYVDEGAGPGNSPWTLFEVDHFSTRTVSFTSQSTGLPAVTGPNPPRDLDGDGRYQDIDGDGEFGIFDVQALFSNLESDAIQNNPTAFDFDDSGDNSVGIFDVQALFEELQSSN